MADDGGLCKEIKRAGRKWREHLLKANTFYQDGSFL